MLKFIKIKLTKSETDDLLPQIKKVLQTGKPWKGEKLHHPAQAIIFAVLTIDGMEKDESEEDSNEGFTTNGWQYDWWQAFTHGGKKYTLSGSGYYGGHSFGPADE